MKRRVVITGVGIYGVLGKTIEEVKNSLIAGKSGIVFDAERKEFGYQSGLTGFIEEPELKGKLDRRMRIGLPEQGAFAFMSTQQAVEMARMDENYFANNEVGILFGNDSSSKAVIEGIDILRDKKDTSRMGSGSIFQSMNSTVSMNLSVIYKLRGINFTIAGACASGSHSVGMAYFLIKNGMQNSVICGGAQELNKYSMGSFDGLGAFSKRENDPTKACRPFDRDRDGLVPSGGAATLVLEDLSTAIKRGATILGEVVGYGVSSDGAHISQPNIDGPSRAIQMALKDSGYIPEKIDYINAHATSTPIGDANEAQAIYSIFGDKTPVSSTKSMTGHEMWMGGASEIIYSLLMMHNDFIAPNINLENPDEHSAKINIIAQTKEAKLNRILSNSFGFGGTNSALIIKRFEL
ncbi:MAG: beta-ketoacyl-[acyl-carrier-protein] synthase family protein [Bacteroidales bacterium]|nr:beta-ketoacyl-[acyl-carrier-protein] synthase family protein [Bacteroidales bacterium]